MHPLELFDRFRRWFGWVAPGRQLWERKPEQVAPDRSDDWLLEPPSLEEARLLFEIGSVTARFLILLLP